MPNNYRIQDRSKYHYMSALSLWKDHQFIAQVWSETEARKKARKHGDYTLRNAKGEEISNFII